MRNFKQNPRSVVASKLQLVEILTSADSPAIVRSVMANDADRGDNYLLYMVESLLAWGAARSFELRR